MIKWGRAAKAVFGVSDAELAAEHTRETAKEIRAAVKHIRESCDDIRSVAKRAVSKVEASRG